ncbi:putative cytokinetic ring protein SteA [Defluviitalea phaphyphila]|uniref:putative cytokinetic ring protein SteA n=1 Tax=Defluviitalea phaphyphila TaxID=1473580 RepID=UPI00073127A0|nr:putative cytokinetic ring protein SteA [Defluviitalea phaphyphila]
MNIVGVAKVDYKTKNLIPRITSKDIAIIDHEDLDYACAYGLASKKVRAVINTSSFISGKYPNRGPKILLNANIPIYENVDKNIFKYIKENDTVKIQGNILIKNNLKVFLKPFTRKQYYISQKISKKNIQNQMNNFIDNTLYYMRKEKQQLFLSRKTPTLNIKIFNRPVLIVIRGEHYIEDLIRLKKFINKNNPVLIGVDGGADAFNYIEIIPDIIFGDMDSVSDYTLKNTKNIIVHGYPNGICPGEKRLKKLKLNYKKYFCFGTSEDAAILMSYFMGASIIITVGSHNNMIDFLEKNRRGMSSTILTRMLTGYKLIDAKGFFKLF